MNSSDTTAPLRQRRPRGRASAPAPRYPALIAVALACSAVGCIVDPSAPDEPTDVADTDGGYVMAPAYPAPAPHDAAAEDEAGDSDPSNEPENDVVVAGCSVSPFQHSPSTSVAWVVSAAALAGLWRHRRRDAG